MSEESYTGGKIIDKGSYSCIYKPPLHCKYNNPKLYQDPKHPIITKLIKKSDAIVEISISNYISKIDKWRRYFVISEAICEINNKQPDLTSCEIYDKNKSYDYRILFMKHYGTSLNNITFIPSKFNPIQFFKHMLEGISRLTINHIVHRDLHSGNFLIDDEYIPRIIDFNLSIFDIDNVKSNMLLHQYAVQLQQEPPDSTIINGMELYNYKLNDLITQIIKKKPIIKKIQLILKLSDEHILKQFKQFNYDTLYTKKNSILWFNEYWRVIDSWAIGAIFISIMYNLYHFKYYITEFKNKEYDKLLYPILYQLCYMDPKYRMDSIQALYHLDPHNSFLSKHSPGYNWLNKYGKGTLMYHN